MAQSFFELFSSWDASKNSVPIAFVDVHARRCALTELIACEAIGADTPWCITRKTGVESAALPGVEPLRAQRDYEFSLDELVRTFHDAPIFKKPEIGNNPFTSASETPIEKSGDPIREIMEIIVGDFESGENYTFYKNLVQAAGMSRIMLDIIINEAVKRAIYPKIVMAI